MNIGFDPTLPAAQQLSGQTLPGGWKVQGQQTRLQDATGSCHSVGYYALSAKGTPAFLKAHDISWVARRPDATVQLEFQLRAFNFEVEVLKRCKDRRVHRVMRSLDSGTINLSPTGGIEGMVPYLVFERADGDLWEQIDPTGQFDTAFALRTLHHVASALRQIHSVQIAHQDLKASNVLICADAVTRLTDMGRAACTDLASPYDAQVQPGDPNHAPPEQLYGHFIPEFRARRYGCDAYQLGNLAVFLFTQQSLTALVQMALPPQVRSGSGLWQGTFNDALPYLQQAFANTLIFLDPIFRSYGVSELTDTVRQLSDPDPERRGHPSERGSYVNRFSMERYISLFNKLATRAETALTRNSGTA